MYICMCTFKKGEESETCIYYEMNVLCFYHNNPLRNEQCNLQLNMYREVTSIINVQVGGILEKILIVFEFKMRIE